MRAYYLRIVGSWFLLILANRILKSAERIMRDSIIDMPQTAQEIAVDIQTAKNGEVAEVSA